jgi:hypothetical protein
MQGANRLATGSELPLAQPRHGRLRQHLKKGGCQLEPAHIR